MEENREREYVESIYDGVEEMSSFYSKFISVTKKGRILDLGCGIGPVSNYLRKFGYDCIGYDIDEYHINKAKKYKPELNLFIGDIREIPAQEVKATGAVYAYSLQNLTDEEIIKSFISCNNNLKEDGTILIFAICKIEVIPRFFVNILNEEKLTELLLKTGFLVECVDYEDDNVICVIASKNNKLKI